MTNRFYPDKQIQNARVARPVTGRVFIWLSVIAVAGTLLSSGFVISARQHFDAVSLGYKSEELRREASRLDEKRRQLELEHARAATPIEIERRASKMGLERPKAPAEVAGDQKAAANQKAAIPAGTPQGKIRRPVLANRKK